MKNIIVSFAIAALTLVGSASAQARDHGDRGYNSGYSSGYSSSYRSCDRPVYTERYLIGYDRCGRAIWGTRVVRRHTSVRYVEPCRSSRYQSYCPPRPYYRNSGIGLRVSFGL